MSIYRIGIASLVVSLAMPLQAGLITGQDIIAAPGSVLDNSVTNSAQQAFDEAQNIVLSRDIAVDGGLLLAGTRVSSHMIFLNKAGAGSAITDYGVTWTFDGIILGVMSDANGVREAASTDLLGAASTLYPLIGTPNVGAFPAAGGFGGFNARGLEGNNGTGIGAEGYGVSGSAITVGMRVTQPGDWIRVVTAAVVPEPASALLLGIGLAGMGWKRRSRRS